MMQMKSLPIQSLLLYIYPNLYPIHYQFDPAVNPPSPVQLTFANIDRNGVYLLDTYDHLYIYICKSVHPQFLSEVLNVTQWSQIPDEGDQNTTTGTMTPVGGSQLFFSNSSISQSTSINSNNYRNRNNNPQSQTLMNGHHESSSSATTSSLHNQEQNFLGELINTDSFASDCTEENSINSYLDHSPTSDFELNNEVNRNANNISNKSTTHANKKTVRKCSTPSVITLPLLNNPTSKRIHEFINQLIDDRPFKPNFHILRCVIII